MKRVRRLQPSTMKCRAWAKETLARMDAGEDVTQEVSRHNEMPLRDAEFLVRLVRFLREIK
jgi:hypothetical protein